MKYCFTLFFISLFSLNAAFSQEPKGDRTLAWQVDMAENNDYDLAIGFAKDACMESIHFALTWSGMEPDADTFDMEYIASTLDVMNIYFPIMETKVELQLAVTNTTTREVPADLSTTNFSAEEMANRFKILLDTMFAHIPDLELAALNIGNESDILFGEDEGSYADFKVFLDAIVPYAKSKYEELHDGAELNIGTTLTLEGMIHEPKAAYCQLLNEGLDIITTTYYPLNSDFTMQNPEVVFDDFEALIAQYETTEQEIYFAECGYASSETCNSSEALQELFYANVFAAWDLHQEKIPYITLFKTTDWSAEAVETFGEYYGIDDPIFLEYLRTLGVRTYEGDGTNKRAYERILCELEARAWCEGVECASLSVTEEKNTSSLYLYPNPATDQVNVVSEAGVIQMNLVNLAGEVILSSSKKTIDLSGLNPGVYFVVIQLDNGSELVRKVIKT